MYPARCGSPVILSGPDTSSGPAGASALGPCKAGLPALVPTAPPGS